MGLQGPPGTPARFPRRGPALRWAARRARLSTLSRAPRWREARQGAEGAPGKGARGDVWLAPGLGDSPRQARARSALCREMPLWRKGSAESPRSFCFCGGRSSPRAAPNGLAATPAHEPRPAAQAASREATSQLPLNENTHLAFLTSTEGRLWLLVIGGFFLAALLPPRLLCPLGCFACPFFKHV